MSIKSWVLGRVQRMNGLVGRGDLPQRETNLEPALEAPRDGASRAGRAGVVHKADVALSDVEHLGVYAALVAAIRDELEHFVASQVRLHLAIAERDRFVLTSIGVRCPDAADARPLLQQFMHEFKPEQVKRYLAREVIAGLPNAAAIDLSQFAGLFDADAHDEADEAGEGGEYRELLAALRMPSAAAATRPYEVSVVGRWAEIDAARPVAAAQPHLGATPSTPLAGRRCEFDVEDGDGRRRVVLQGVVPGRRYVVGKGEGCDIRVNATYASRRHAEIWLDNGVWWVADAGSTNGLRVESAGAPPSRKGADTPVVTTAAALEQPTRLAEGARIVLSARAEGPASDYPWLAMRSPENAVARITPIAVAASPRTPLTAILPARPGDVVLSLNAVQGSGAHTLELRRGMLPVTVGRSRNQTLVVDRRHDGVSGHHLDIVEMDESGAEVVVHGDNGVLVNGVRHTVGTRLHWQAGETMVLGASLADHPTCTLTLVRHGHA